MTAATANAPAWLTANPAVELMARLSYPKKIQMVGLVAGIAILLLTGQLFFSLAGQIERASLERTGLLLVQPVRAVLEPLQQHRGLANAWSSGDDDYRAAHGEVHKAMRERAAQIDSALLGAEQAMRAQLPALADDPRWLSAQRRWRDLRDAAGASPDEVLEGHNQIITDLNGVISSAADATHLSVDPYVGTFYLAQLVTRQLPMVIEQASKIRDIGAGVYASRELDRDRKFLIISLNTMTAAGLEEAQGMVEQKVLATMPELRQRLLGDATAFAGVAGAVDTFTQFKLLGKLFDMPPEAFFAGMTWNDAASLQRFAADGRALSLDSGEAIPAGPIGSLYTALDHYTKVLDGTIEDRLWRLRQQLALNLLVAFVALVVVIYMLYLMYVAFPIRKLIAATEEVAGGNLEVKLEIERNDEIGQLARAFNTMTEAVKYTQNNLEHLVSERTAELSEKNRMIMDSINYARVIQSSFLRASRQDMAATLDDYFMLWEPRDVVGGDYLFFRKFDDGYFFAVIDCTGHGVPGAFMTLIMASYLNNLLVADNRHDPAALLGRMNRAVKQALGQYDGASNDDEGHRSDDGMDAAFVWVDSTSHTLTYAGAKTPLFFLPADNEVIDSLDGERKGVGYVDTPMDFTWSNSTLALSEGMAIYVSTDGVIDQIGDVKRMAYGKRRLHQAILRARHLPMQEQCSDIYESYLEHQGTESRRDDVSMFAFRYTPTGVLSS